MGDAEVEAEDQAEEQGKSNLDHDIIVEGESRHDRHLRLVWRRHDIDIVKANAMTRRAMMSGGDA